MFDFLFSFSSIALTILVFLLIFGVLIVIHELGHFWAARIAKVEVKEFGFGIPPKIFGIRTRSTLSKGTPHERTEEMEWTVNTLPFGGFVRMTGEHEDSHNPYAFGNRPLFLRMLVICGGVIMNFLLGWGIFTIALGIGIEPVPYTIEEYNDFIEQEFIIEKKGYFISFPSDSSIPLPSIYKFFQPGDRIISPLPSEDFLLLSPGESIQVERFNTQSKTFEIETIVLSEAISLHRSQIELQNIIPESPAEKSGLQKGDKIILIQGEQVKTKSDLLTILSSVLSSETNQNISITVQRDDQNYTVIIQPDKSGKIGIQWGDSFHPEGITLAHHSKGYVVKNIQYPWVQAPLEAFQYSFISIQRSIEALKGMVKEVTSSFSLPSEIGGPVAIAHHTDTLLEHGSIMDLLVFTAMLSLSLAVLNIMPFPGLDGGRFVFLLLEGLLRIKSWILINIFKVKKTISVKIPAYIESGINVLGFLLLIGLLIWVTGKDIYRLFLL